MVEFQGWPKIARLNREIIVSEKIDGTNACIVIEEYEYAEAHQADGGQYIVSDDLDEYGYPNNEWLVHAQSRTRIITPEKDNFGFAKWVYENAHSLVWDLGPGRHYGEWWGQGIQRKYGQTEKRFSLFNADRFGDKVFLTPGVDVVPVLYRGTYDAANIDYAIESLRDSGSRAAPGFMKPEGVVVYHVAAGTSFKVTLEGDEVPKGIAEKQKSRKKAA